MRNISALLALAFFAPVALMAAPVKDHDMPAPGIWTNTEDEYFAEEEGRDRPDWLAYEIGTDGQWRTIDAFGEPLSDWSEDEIPALSRRAGGSWEIAGSELRQAREFRCWFSVRKGTPAEDGSEDWTFQRDMPIFDQGGRIRLEGGADWPEVTIRMRSVTWAEGSTNNPVIVLYVHRDDPDRAESYSWAAPESAIVGINLRWVQGGCNRDSERIGPQDAA